MNLGSFTWISLSAGVADSSMVFAMNVSLKINARHVSPMNTTSTPQVVSVKPVLTHYRDVNHARMDRFVQPVRIPTICKEENA